MAGRNKGMKINREMASSTRRNVFKGYEPLNRLAKLSEAQEMMLGEEENRLFEVNYQLKKLVKDMEDMESNKDEIQAQ